MTVTNDFFISPSSFKQAMLCPASAFLSQTPMSEPARLGSIFHKLAVDKVRGIKLSKDDWKTIKRENFLEDKDIKDMAIALSRITMKIPEGSILITEGLYTGLEGKLRGTPDVVLFEGNKASIIDWKYGMVEVDEAENNYQGMCYAVLVWLHNKQDINEVSFYIVQPRTNSISTVKYLRDDLERMANWIEESYDSIVNNREQYNYGNACGSCFKSTVCPEFKARFHAIANIDPKDVDDTTKMKDMMLMIKPIKSVIEQVERHAKAWVEENGDLDCGAVIYTQAEKNYDIMDNEKIYEHLKDTTYISKVIKFNKTLMYKHIPDAKHFLKTMEDEGALYKRPTKYYTFKKKKIVG